MAEKLVLRRQRPNTSNGVKPIFVDAQVIKQLREVKEETGIPMGRLTEIFIAYAMKNIEVVNEDDGGE